MIVVPHDTQLRIVTQVDHAHFAAELASLWRADGLPAHPRRDDLLFAIREHDNGWQEADSAPTVDPVDGRPYDFIGLPDGARIDVWRRATERFRSERPWVALLIGRHAVAVNRARSTPAWNDLFDELEEYEGEQAEQNRLDRAELDRDYEWLSRLDAISLTVCNRWTSPLELGRLRAAFGDDRLELDPFPLAGQTRFPIRWRTIPDRRYASDTDLAVELASARWEIGSATVTKRNKLALDAPA